MSANDRLEKVRRLLQLRGYLEQLATQRRAYADEFMELKASLEADIDSAIEAGEPHPAPCLPQIDYRLDGGMTKIIFKRNKEQR